MTKPELPKRGYFSKETRDSNHNAMKIQFGSVKGKTQKQENLNIKPEEESCLFCYFGICFHEKHEKPNEDEEK